MSAVITDKKLTPHFRASEFRCRCRRPLCDALPMQQLFMQKLEHMRVLFGLPLTITSGTRCDTWNRMCNGSPKSQHLLGNAADILILGDIDGVALAALAEKCGMGGIGRYASWVHVDNGPPNRRWEIL